MSQTPPPTIDPAPSVPIRGTPTFKTLVDAFLNWLALVVTQFQAVATNVYNNALDAYTNAGIAAAGAAAAVAATGVAPFVSGATYAAGASASSLVNFRTYRRTAAGSGVTDPSADPLWVPTSWGAFPRIHVQERQASGTQSASNFTGGVWGTHVVNTLLQNSITGASLSGNNITLPAGTYQVDISCPYTSPNPHRARLYDVTNGATLVLGTSEFRGGAVGTSRSTMKERFTLTSTRTIRIESQGVSSTYGGYPASVGLSEVYLDAVIEQVGT